jgi:hypothetical protein
MWMWCALLTTRSKMDSATTGFGNNEYQSVAALLAVAIKLFPVLSLTSS